jgi:hypothetical protein
LTPAELQAWQDRVFGPVHGAQTKAAETLGVPVQTYRNWLWGIYRVPRWAERFTRHIDRFGTVP